MPQGYKANSTSFPGKGNEGKSGRFIQEEDFPFVDWNDQDVSCIRKVKSSAELAGNRRAAW